MEKNKIKCEMKCDVYPPCIMQTIIEGIDIEDVITGSIIKRSKHLVCYKNALTINETKVIKNESCEQCGLCETLCKTNNKLVIEADRLEKIMFKLDKLNMIISETNKDAIIATEVKANGNSRNKRIDLIIKSGNKIELIKVLKDINNGKIYERSYKKIIQEYEEKYKEIEFEQKMLVKKADYNNAMTIYENVIRIDDLLQK